MNHSRFWTMCSISIVLIQGFVHAAEKSPKNPTEAAASAKEEHQTGGGSGQPAESNTAIIPLKEIWAYEMPGTRDVRKLEPDKFGEAAEKLTSSEQLQLFEKSLTSQILQTLGFNKPGQQPKRGFAVMGTGADALREAHAVLVKGRNPKESLPVGSEISVVFYSHLFGYYVRLHEIKKQPGAIVIQYHFVPHRTKEMTRHFALIPVGELAPGDVKVEILRSPQEQNLAAAGFKAPDAATDSRVVSQSFRFRVESEKTN